MTEFDNFWPYILLMPSEYEVRVSFIKDVLASRIASSVLPRFEENGTVLQRDLVSDLSHSNKSILRYLDVLRSYGLIETGSKIDRGKRVVFHELTKRGWGLVRFFTEGLPADVSELTESLLEDYLTSLLQFYREHSLEESVFFEILTRVRAKSMVEGSTSYETPDFVITGASSLFTEIQSEPFSKDGTEVTCKMPHRYPGGPSLELAMALADQNHKVVLVSSIGDDLNGWKVLTSLISRGIDVRHFTIESEKRTNETIIIDDGKSPKRLVGIDERFSLSLTSPSQIPWDIVRRSKAVYIGEVFLEIALAIASYCYANGIPTIFRCSQHYWKLGLSRITPLLSQIDLLLISPQEWEVAREVLKGEPVAALRKHTNAQVLIKIDRNQYGLLLKDSDTMKVVKNRSSSEDLESLFISNLISSFSASHNLEDAYLVCTSKGAKI
ncbi:MAG: carbohydrate kinase family protein [Candidatus Thorarchaeota archaeon]